MFGSEEGMTISVKELAGTEKLVDAYKNIYDNREEIQKKLLEMMPEYSKKALVSGEALKELIG